MNTKISKVISETVFDPSVKEHRNQLTVFFDDGDSIKYEFYNEDSALDFIDTVSKFNKRGFYDKLTGYEFDMKLDSLRNQIVNNFYLSQHNEVSQWN